ncbi:MAG: transposase [Candidatus Shapirobacteria bacterium]|nr:transposase [Candidatus Shapirobacteria bacterium]
MPVDNPDLFADKFRVKSARLEGRDYSLPGFYFITICTHNKNKFFGKIINGKIKLSKVGKIVETNMILLSNRFNNIVIDIFVIMPNHIHIVFKINKCSNEFLGRDAINRVSTNQINIIPNPMKQFSLGTVIRYFKAKVKFDTNRQKLFFTWQSRYYDRIIRTEKEYWAIKQYIDNNPKNWQKDVCYK